MATTGSQDWAVWDLNDIRMNPVGKDNERHISNLIYNGGNCLDLWVGGNPLMQSGKVVSIDEDALIKEGANVVFVGQGVTADNNIKPTYLTSDGTVRSADHEFGITLSHDTGLKKTTITFTKEVPSAGTLIKVERSNDKYLKFRDKGIINGQ